MATLANLLLGYRYFLFAIFVVCNVVIASVAVWNYSLLQNPDAIGVTGRDRQIDAYLIILGIFGVVFIIPIIIVDFLRKHAIPNRVWFECLWVGVFWVLELAGASALTTSASGMLCGPDSKALCVSTDVLLAFAWLCTIFLLVYLLALAISAILNQEKGLEVWQSGVRHFPWFAATRSSLNSAPPSPTRQWQKPLQLAGPRPDRPMHQTTLTKLDLEAEYGMTAEQRLKQSYQTPRPAPVPQMQQTEPSLYPAHLQSHLPTTSRAPEPSRTQQQQHRRTAAASESSSPASVVRATSAPRRATDPTTDPAGRTRPRHPRTGSNGSPSRQRPVPPPLDLTSISAYRTIDERVSRR